MTPVGSPTTSARPFATRTLLLIATASLALTAAVALGLIGGGSAGAETVSFLPTSASCSNTTATDDTPAACSAGAGTLAPGGGAAILETDNTAGTQGDDDLQAVFNLGGLDAARITSASIQIGSTQSGDAGTIQVGGPSISATNYGSVPVTGGTTSNGALTSAVTGAAGGSLTVWMQVACAGASDDCGAAIDSVRLNVELQDLTPTVSLLVSGSANRSGAQALSGAELQDNAYVFVNPGTGISQVRFFLDDPARSNPIRVESASPYDLGGTNGASANPWNTNSVAAGAHTIAAEVDFSNGTSTVVSANFTTGDPAPAPAPTPGSPALLVSGNANRTNSVALSGATLTQNAYIHVSPSNGITRVRFFLDDPARTSVDRTENAPPFDFGGTTGGGTAAPWNPGSVADGSHTLAAVVEFANGSSSIVAATFATGGSPPPAPTATPSPTPGPAPAQGVFVSTNSNRANPVALNGQTFDGNIYVFILSGDGVQQARFWLDDRNRNGAADRVENLFPFDFAGGSASQAGALNAGSLSEGTHWISVELDGGGGTQVVEGSFQVPTAGGGGGGGGGGIPIPPGAIAINPGQSIQAFVNANPAGSTFVIRSGVYRMQTVAPKNNNIFIGEPGAILNGSRVLTGWVDAGGGDYYVGNQTQQTPPKGGCDSSISSLRCQYAEQVFVNSTPLTQVFSRGALNASNFYFDYGANRIYIGQNPGGKFIETSVAQRAFAGGGTNVTVSGLIVEKYSTRAQEGAIHASTGWIVRNNEVRYNHGTGIRDATNSRILDNFVHHNGQMGIGGTGSDILVEGNEVSYNNTEAFLVDWEGGGMKFTNGRNQVFRGNYVHHNKGRGIWTDLNVIDSLVEDNVVEYNDYEGIKHEISYATVIRNNLVRFNGTFQHDWLWGAQILIQNSRNGQVYGNEVWVSPGGSDGITIVHQDNRGSGTFGPHNSSNNVIRNNEVHFLGVDGDTGQNCSAVGRGNVFNNNTYYGPRYHFVNLRTFVSCDLNNWDEWRQEGYDPGGQVIYTSGG